MEKFGMQGSQRWGGIEECRPLVSVFFLTYGLLAAGFGACGGYSYPDRWLMAAFLAHFWGFLCLFVMCGERWTR